MTTFDDREKAFEDKFAHDAGLTFKAKARRDKKLGQWAAGKLGLTGAEASDYVKTIQKMDISKDGEEAVVGKVAGDFKARAIDADVLEIRSAMTRYLSEAVAEIERSID